MRRRAVVNNNNTREAPPTPRYASRDGGTVAGEAVATFVFLKRRPTRSAHLSFTSCCALSLHSHLYESVWLRSARQSLGWRLHVCTLTATALTPSLSFRHVPASYRIMLITRALTCSHVWRRLLRHTTGVGLSRAARVLSEMSEGLDRYQRVQ